ncbi:MAG: HypC/HybG/HupF family hydrogenase formation chaperone [Bacillota bacterium]
MCLAIPMQVVTVDGTMARCSANGIEREVSLFLLPSDSIACGDFVIVHVGYAIQKIAPEDAEATWGLVDVLMTQGARDA